MKSLFFVSAFVSILGTLPTSLMGQNTNVNLLDLTTKEFKHIAKFDEETTMEEISRTLAFLKQFNPSIAIERTINEETKKISFVISSDAVACRSDDFGVGIILLDKNNVCECAIGDREPTIE